MPERDGTARKIKEYSSLQGKTTVFTQEPLGKGAYAQKGAESGQRGAVRCSVVRGNREPCDPPVAMILPRRRGDNGRRRPVRVTDTGVTIMSAVTAGLAKICAAE